MRVVSSKPNTLRLMDNISGTTIELYYRTPTAAEQAGYTNGMTKRVRNRIVNCTGECRQKHGKDILEGWRDGDFGEEIGGKAVAVSSNPGSQGYRPDWKEWFAKHNADLVERLAIHAFEASTDLDDGEDLDDGKDMAKQEEFTDPN